MDENNNENEYKNENKNDETETKTNNKWDYDIKGIEDGENENDQYDNDKLSAAVESKLKQSVSLVDILMERPQIVNDEHNNDNNDEKEVDTQIVDALHEKLENATD